MTHGSLFSGIGGFDLAAEWMGWQNIFHCEWNPFGQKVLKHYWPQSISYNDITKTDFTIHAGTIDVLTGGFPCQPYSAAGKRLGKEDERHLWPEMLRAIREIQPGYIIGENVSGLTNWNGGMVFDEVQADMEAEGYEVLPFLLPACAVNAPHRRDRIWFVAYGNAKQREWQKGRFQPQPEHRQDGSNWNATDADSGATRSSGKSAGTFSERSNDNDEPEERGKQTKQHIRCNDVLRHATDTKGKRIQGNGANREQFTQIQAGKRLFGCNHTGTNWQHFPTQPPVCSGDDGLSTKLDGITFSKWRNESIKAYGNAIVPQVAYQIFKAIQQMEEL